MEQALWPTQHEVLVLKNIASYVSMATKNHILYPHKGHDFTFSVLYFYQNRMTAFWIVLWLTFWRPATAAVIRFPPIHSKV